MFDHSSGVDDGHLTGERQGVDPVVGHQQGGARGLGEHLAEHAAHGRCGLGVERRERLVEQEHVGVRRECAGEGDALGLSAGQCARPPIGEVGRVDGLEPSARESLGLGSSGTS